jgi:elongator complex protein 2
MFITIFIVDSYFLIAFKFHIMHTLIGHEDWIRDLDICKISSNDLLISSCSQDCYIRLWKLTSHQIQGVTNFVTTNVEQLNEEHDVEEDDEEDEENSETEIKLKSTVFHLNLKNKQYEFSLGLESVLYGHEDFIYSVRWHPFDLKKNRQPLMLLSASLDKTIVLWKYDESNSLWLDIVGQIFSQAFQLSQIKIIDLNLCRYVLEILVETH